MHNTSGDEEFFDAFGDEAQMEAFKARSYYQPMSDDLASRTTWDKNSDASTRQISRALTRTRTPKPHHLDEIENTLAITAMEGHKEAIARNLQQILDKLDETGVNVSHHVSHSVSNSVSHDVPSSSALKGKNKVESTKETEIESPAVIQTNNASTQKPHNLPLPPSIKSVPKIEEATEQVQELAPGTTRSMKSSTKNPLQMSLSSSMKKPMFSLLHRKRSLDSEFTRENIKQNNRNTSNFDKLICLQSIEDDKKSDPAQSASKKAKNGSATWIVKFSPNNKLLATGGNDGILRIFNVSIMDDNIPETTSEGELQILDPNYISLTGHKSDIIDICWYQNSNLVLTSSIDKMVILWNVESRSAVKVFEHSDIVPCVAFHPLIDGFFATGCFDKRIRIWDINETKVVDWVHTNDIITALAFSPDKTLLLVGFFKGTIKMYRIDQGKLKFTMEITCKNAFSWGKLNKSGKKVTAIVFTEDYEFLVMTNDSRMRLINLKNLETKVKYKGHISGKYHIQPSYNFEKELILTGSEDEKVYVWNKVSDYVPQINPMYIGQKSNRNTSYEYFKPYPKANTTCAVWVPFPALQKYKEKILSIWNDIYVDSLMVLFSSDSRIKVLANLVELEAVQDRK